MSDLEDESGVQNEAKRRHDVTIDDVSSFEANLSKYIDDNVIGQKTTFRGPVGRKRVVYCDNSKTGEKIL